MKSTQIRQALLEKKKELLQQLLKSSAKFRLAQTAEELDALLHQRASILESLQKNDAALEAVPQPEQELANSATAMLQLELEHLLRSLWANNQASQEGLTSLLQGLDAERKRLEQGTKVTSYLGSKRMPGVVPNPKFLRNGGYKGGA